MGDWNNTGLENKTEIIGTTRWHISRRVPTPDRRPLGQNAPHVWCRTERKLSRVSTKSFGRLQSFTFHWHEWHISYRPSL